MSRLCTGNFVVCTWHIMALGFNYIQFPASAVSPVAAIAHHSSRVSSPRQLFIATSAILASMAARNYAIFDRTNVGQVVSIHVNPVIPVQLCSMVWFQIMDDDGIEWYRQHWHTKRLQYAPPPLRPYWHRRGSRPQQENVQEFWQDQSVQVKSDQVQIISNLHFTSLYNKIQQISWFVSCQSLIAARSRTTLLATEDFRAFPGHTCQVHLCQSIFPAWDLRSETTSQYVTMHNLVMSPAMQVNYSLIPVNNLVGATELITQMMDGSTWINRKSWTSLQRWPDFGPHWPCGSTQWP